MPIFPQHKVVFIHIPKTGGVSIEQELILQGDTQFFLSTTSIINGHSPQHSTYQELLDWGMIPPDYRVFTVVRDPRTRFLSAYNFRKGGISMEDLIASPDDAYDRHCMPMYKFLEGGEERITIFKQETLAADFQAFFGFPLTQQQNISSPLRLALSSEIQFQVLGRYLQDFNQFHYEH